ncbi:melibiose:sodium transporter MelB [Psychromonas ossibalaenae]|uniref:melibiose:sodium transporter MelB n=1 Tax=Psychromonas ossibalaenae TaxID=444922 RepID=UPI00036AF84B|nr:melibiose:sodium transporter MelB [Psychromonas ossibalaenae]
MAGDNHKVGLNDKISYGIGSFGANYAIAIVYMYLMYYYTDVVGVSAATIGVIFFIARIWDAVNDPVMGWVVNNTRSRWGKFKPWIFIGCILNIVSLIMLFSAHHFSGLSQIAFITFSYIFWGMSFTLIDAPFWSILPTLTLDKREREKTAPYPRFFATVANLLMAAMVIPAVAYFGGENEAEGFQKLAIFIGIVFFICIVILLTRVKEKYSSSSNSGTKESKKSLKDTIKLIKHNSQLCSLLVMSLSYNLACNIIVSFAIYYFTYVIGNKDMFPYYMAYAGIANIIIIILFPYLAKQFSRKTLWLSASIFPILGLFLLFAVGLYFKESLALVIFAGVMFQIGTAFFWTLIIIMVADTIDYGEHKLGVRCESIAYSVQTLVVKAGSAFAGLFIGLFLSITQFVPNTTQSDSTLLMMNLFMTVLPLVFFSITMFVYQKYYKLEGDKLEEIQRELKLKYSKVENSDGSDNLAPIAVN